MDWRQWIFETLVSSSSLTAIVNETSIFSAGAVTGRPDTTPFIVIRLGLTSPRVGDARECEGSIWVHDDPGSYDRIDNILNIIENVLDIGPVPEIKAISCEWTGRSSDFSDDVFQTITKNSTFNLISRK